MKCFLFLQINTSSSNKHFLGELNAHLPFKNSLNYQMYIIIVNKISKHKPWTHTYVNIFVTKSFPIVHAHLRLLFSWVQTNVTPPPKGNKLSLHDQNALRTECCFWLRKKYPHMCRPGHGYLWLWWISFYSQSFFSPLTHTLGPAHCFVCGHIGYIRRSPQTPFSSTCWYNFSCSSAEFYVCKCYRPSGKRCGGVFL